MRVTWTASPPFGSIRQTCGLPEREEMKAIVRPSGDQRGFMSAAGLEVSRLGSPPRAGTSQMSLAPRFASLSMTVTT